jgi:hypothetical protein
LTPRDQLNQLSSDKATDDNNAKALANAQKAKDDSAAAVVTDTATFVATIRRLGGRLVDTLANPPVEYTTDGTTITTTQVSTLDSPLPDEPAVAPAPPASTTP